MKLILHCLLLQSLWWSCILSAVHLGDYPWLPLLWVPVLLGLWHKTPWFQNLDIRLALIFTGFGLVLDSLWVNLGWIEYANHWPLHALSPLWLLVLWFGVGFDFRHSLLWIEQRPIIGGIIAGASGPMSYISGAALGLAEFPEGTKIPFCVAVFITWAIAFPLFARYVTRLEQKPQPEL